MKPDLRLRLHATQAQPCFLAASNLAASNAVSYTHLDVYKRQQLNREYSQRIEKLKIQADEYRQAASQYESAEKTVAQLKAEMLRLDVYKRQMQAPVVAV